MSNIELEFAKSNLIETVGALISCGEISIEEAVSLFAERLAAFVRKPKETAVVEEDTFPDFGVLEQRDSNDTIALNEIPSTADGVLALIRTLDDVPGFDVITGDEVRGML